MKKTILLLLITVFAFNLSAQDSQAVAEQTTLIFVRHAEKADDDPRNPTLAKEGKERAERLKKLLLEEFSITAVYSTPYHRTRDTAMPTAEELELEIQEYGFSNTSALIEEWVSTYRGGVVLILGHSNTTPMFVNMVLGEERYEQLEESDYSKIFIIRTSKVGEGEVEVREY